MPIKIVENHSFDKDGEITVTLDEVQQLVNNYYRNVKKTTNLASQGVMDRKLDSRSAWFSRSKVEELFSLNNGCDGLRIYFGVHDGKAVKIEMPEYMNQIMVVLVATKNDTSNPVKPIDLLNNKNFVNIAGVLDLDKDAAGNGLDNGKLCPPAQNCDGTVISVM